jgi:flavin reductase (DIM6/NTAB) family NADH-FMN oxidoreductase RutF
MYLDFSTLSPTQTYHTIIQTVIPRPIAWVLTENDNGSHNLAPFSFFTPVSSSPPLLMISVGNKSVSDKKDTARNIIEKKQCVVHIADQSLVEPMNASAQSFGYDESEIELLGLTTVEFEGSALPRLKAAPVAYACDFYEMKAIGDAPMSLLFLEIKHAYINDEIAQQGEDRLSIDAGKLDPLARLGGNDYSGLSESYTLERKL